MDPCHSLFGLLFGLGLMVLTMKGADLTGAVVTEKYGQVRGQLTSIGLKLVVIVTLIILIAVR
ncbi:hypothetical protein HY628_02415 [Candidatus Uhrbacteria bacterium]|nr:hypothetical protein [Candidatus Uhrbacteria bacterium]